MLNLDLTKIPSGSNIQIKLTDQEATNYAENYLTSHIDEVKSLINQKVKTNLDVSNPEIHFDEDEVFLSLKAGIKFVKATAKATASVLWDGSKALVNVKTLDIPVLKLDASKANSIIQQPLKALIEDIQKDFVIKSFKLHKGSASIDAVKK